MMKTAIAITAVLAVCILAGCNTAFWGNIAVLLVSAGIFFGTLSLGRVATSTTRSDFSGEFAALKDQAADASHTTV